jgi:hypothetical protein
MGQKLRDKDYRTGYEQGYRDALKQAMSIIHMEWDRHNKEIKVVEEYGSISV